MKVALGVIAALAAIAVVAVSTIGAPALTFLVTYGCHGAEDQLAESMKAHRIFETYPPGAQAQGQRESTCDDDDRVVDVSQEYRLPSSRDDVIDFYRKLALRDGWKPSPEMREADDFCFTKAIDGKDTDLTVWTGDESDTFYVGLSSSIESGGWWC
ncbi:hypothetical protein ABT294_42535 [Nonomuraea sp. NPDC000554]|uniref:hypothetical protein n=1 Tax=Nonomuraea sp. NPDC000554 TaxID=3154259 RepID=UPI00332F2516